MKTSNYLNILFLSIIYIILTPIKSLANPTIKPRLNLSEYELEQSLPFNNNSYLPKNSTNILSESELLLSESTNNLEAETKLKNLPQDTFDNYFENSIDHNFNNNFVNNEQTKAENNIKNNNNDPKDQDNQCSLEPTVKKKEYQEIRDNNIAIEANIEIINQDFYIKEIKIIGSTVLKIKIKEKLEETLKNIENKGKKITFKELEQELKKLAVEITKLYLDKDYINSSAKFDPNQLLEEENNEEIAIIKVTEGKIEDKDITVKGADRLKNYVCQRIALAATKIPFNPALVEEQLRLLKTNPLFDSVEARLKRSGEEGKTKLVVTVEKAKDYFGTFGFDNYSPPSIGDVRMVADFGYRNLAGLGDTFSLSYRPRVENFNTYRLDINYQVPLNPMAGRLQFRVSLQNNEVISSSDRDLQKLLETIDINGDSQYYEISYRQPVIRSPKEELAFSVGLNYRNGQNFVSDQPVAFGCGVGNNGICITNVLLLGQDYTLRQETGAWAFRSQFRVGTGIFKVTQNPEPIPDGYFFSWLGQIQRVQLINDSNFLIIQGDIQLTPDALVPSEQFVIGGAQSVRGYRQNVRAGDNGFRISIEDRITIVRDKDTAIPVFQLAPFFDMGSIWNNPKNPNIEPDQTFVAGIGLGLIWQPVEEMNIRLDYGYPIIDLKDRGDNIQDDGLYFNIKYNF